MDWCWWVVIIVGIFAVIVVIAKAIENANAPIYRVILRDTQSCAFEDEEVRLVFNFVKPVNLNELKTIDFLIDNFTNEPIRIDWDASAFVDPNGQSQRIIHAGVKFIARDSAQAPSVVASSSQLTESLIPASNIYWHEESNGDGWWKSTTLMNRWGEQDTFVFRLLLTMKILGKEKHYEFRFVAEKVKNK